MSKTKKEIEQELENISEELRDAEADIESWIDNIQQVAIDLSDTKGLIIRCQDSIRTLSEEIEADRIEEEKEIPVLKLINWDDFLALKEGMLTQIRLSRKFTDNLKIGQVVEIYPSSEGESEPPFKRKVIQIHTAPFLNTSGATRSIVHFENIGE